MQRKLLPDILKGLKEMQIFLVCSKLGVSTIKEDLFDKELIFCLFSSYEKITMASP
jgi:hypothetical protein